MNILLTVPHGGLDGFINDVAAIPVAKTLSSLLTEHGIAHDLLINSEPRSMVDMNRKESRGTQYRETIDSVLREGNVDFLLDIHSYPSTVSSMFRGYDMIPLESYKEQGNLPKMYAKMLMTLYPKSGLAITTMKADNENDVVKRAYEFGVPAVLVEHDECGPVTQYAYLNFLAIKSIVGSGKYE